MARKKKQPEAQPGAPLFMATYGDMVTLLLCFFVLLYSFSTLDVKKFEMLAASLQMAFHIQPGGPSNSSPVSLKDGALMQGRGEAPTPSEGHRSYSLQRVLAMVQEAIKSERLEDEIQIVENERGVAISMSEQILFGETSAELNPEGARILYKIGAFFEGIPNFVAVEGHTDNMTPTGSRYRDNWALSAARAATVAAYLDNAIGIDQSRLRAVGLGSSAPVVPNDSPAHRSLNRRVDLIILSEYSIR